jgi:hypothetical protein
MRLSAVAFGIPHGIEAMSWITIGWSVASAACATLALIHLAIWYERRSHVAHLIFATDGLWCSDLSR